MHTTTLDSSLAQRLVLPGRALNWIDGDFADARQRSISFNPATGEEIGTFADASREDDAVAIEAAGQAGIEDFLEYKHIAFKSGVIDSAARG